MEKKNNQVPAEAILEQVIKDNKKLLWEIEQLKTELKKKENAIAEFKKWQEKIKKRSYEYWLEKYIQDHKEDNDIKKYKDLLKTYNCDKELHKKIQLFFKDIKNYFIMNGEMTPEKMAVIIASNSSVALLQKFDSINKAIERFYKFLERTRLAFDIYDVSSNQIDNQ